jgi:hypothetical protein
MQVQIYITNDYNNYSLLITLIINIKFIQYEIFMLLEII